MKKTLLTIFSGVLLACTASAQCTPDPQFDNSPGNFFPDSASFIDNDFAIAGQDYMSQIDVKTITDTAVTVQGFSVVASIDAFKVHAVEGAPAGFGFTGGGPTFEIADPRPDFNDMVGPDSTWWNVYGTPGDPSTLSPTRGCLSIFASAADVTNAAPASGFTDYPVIVFVDARVAATTPDVSAFLLANGTWLSETALADPLPVDGYILRVYANDPNSVTQMLDTKVFDVAQSYPNPAGNEATITFTTPRIENIDIKVFNMLGAVVYDQTILSESGVNDVVVNTGRMSSGMYIYTVSNGAETFTKKMTVK